MNDSGYNIEEIKNKIEFVSKKLRQARKQSKKEMYASIMLETKRKIEEIQKLYSNEKNYPIVSDM